MKYENAKKQTEKLQNQCEKDNDAMLFYYFSHEQDDDDGYAINMDFGRCASGHRISNQKIQSVAGSDSPDGSRVAAELCIQPN
ncbi:MAG: hypothetical protein ABI686_09825 [Acidobacteriota bacterium]